jgi:hypothetical protein
MSTVDNEALHALSQFQWESLKLLCNRLVSDKQNMQTSGLVSIVVE